MLLIKIVWFTRGLGNMIEYKKYRKVLGLIEDNNGDLLDLTEIEERLNEQDETIQHVTKTLQSFSKRDLVDIERVFLNNLCKELGIKLEWLTWIIWLK